MEIFLDSVDIKEIKEFSETGLVNGVTTNPSLIAKSGKDIIKTIKEICSIIDGPVSAEVVALEEKNMLEEALKLREIAQNVVIKLPCTWEGIKTCKKLADQNIMVNMTLCFSTNQALLSAKAGAAFISPFVGRLDDAGFSGVELVESIATIMSNYEFDTEVLAASLRNPQHINDVAMAGADIATIPPKLLKELILHPMTDQGLDKFLTDWKKTGQKIT